MKCFFVLLKFAIQEFYDDREYNNLSQRTVEGYREILSQFYDYCVKEDVVDVHDITTRLIKDYIVYYRKKGNNPTTTNTKLRRIKTFLNFLVAEEIIKENPADKLQQVKEDIQIEVFTDYHIKQMLNYFKRIKGREKTMFDYRGHSMILFLLSTGIRQTELCNARWSDVDFEYHSLEIFGKNRKTETIPITEKLVKELSAYRLFLEQKVGKGNLSEYIFTNHYNKQMTPNAVQNIFKRLSDKMNFKDVRLSCHTFRHTFCQRFRYK